MPSVDLFIPAAPKDYDKLPYVLRGVANHLPDVQAVHVCTPTDEAHADGEYRFPVYYHLDQDVLPFNVTRFKFRPTWVYQQFLKLFQQVTAGDWYLVMDADKIVNRDLSLFDNEKPRLFLPNHDQNHGPYFEYSRVMLDVGREYPCTFLSECTLYNRVLLDEMFSVMSRQEWLDKSAEIITATCCIGDAELYGNWVAKHHPNFYQYVTIVDAQRGRYNGDWTAGELDKYLVEMNGSEVDILSAHSWHD